MEKDKLTFDFLFDRGFIPTRVVGGNTTYNKWGLELDIHCNFVYCKARIKSEKDKYEEKYLHSKSDLINLEKLMEINETPLMTKMTVDELKKLIPIEYSYFLNKRKKKIQSESNMSFNTKRGRYIIKKGESIISEGYNDEEEDYFLCRSLLYILMVENLMPKNSI